MIPGGNANNFPGIRQTVAVCNQLLSINKLRKKGMCVSGRTGPGAFGGPNGGMRAWLRLTCRRLSADRRGVTAVMFAVAALAVLGFVGLAAEGGTWYLEKRHGQNAADAAATAGALAIANNPITGASTTLTRSELASPSALAAATATGANYTSSNVGITVGTFSGGTFTANSSGTAVAVQANVTTTLSPQFSAAFLSQTQIPISETAVAMVAADSPACVLAGSSQAGAGVGSVEFDDTAIVTASGCSVASNGLSSAAITLDSGASVSAQSLVSSGECSGCAPPPPLITYQPQTLDPFANTIYTTASLSTKNSPLTIAQCNSLGNASTVPVPWGTAPHQINCDGLSSTGSAVNLAAGTYIFYSSASRLSSIAVTGGSISCNGCTIIMTGDSSAHIGTINITGTITLTAPATNDFDSNFNGVLFYRDQQATANANATTVTINGTAGSTLTGVMYFPTSTVTYTGNGTNTPSCSVIIAAYLKLTGGSQFSTGEPSTGGCAAALVPWTQSVRLVK